MAKKSSGKGWWYESTRHRLAALGIKTKPRHAKSRSENVEYLERGPKHKGENTVRGEVKYDKDGKLLVHGKGKNIKTVNIKKRTTKKGIQPKKEKTSDTVKIPKGGVTIGDMHYTPGYLKLLKKRDKEILANILDEKKREGIPKEGITLGDFTYGPNYLAHLKEHNKPVYDDVLKEWNKPKPQPPKATTPTIETKELKEVPKKQELALSKGDILKGEHIETPKGPGKIESVSFSDDFPHEIVYNVALPDGVKVAYEEVSAPYKQIKRRKRR